MHNMHPMHQRRQRGDRWRRHHRGGRQIIFRGVTPWWGQRWWPQPQPTYNWGASYWQMVNYLRYLESLQAQGHGVDSEVDQLREAIEDLSRQVAMLQGQLLARSQETVVVTSPAAEQYAPFISPGPASPSTGQFPIQGLFVQPQRAFDVRMAPPDNIVAPMASPHGSESLSPSPGTWQPGRAPWLRTATCYSATGCRSISFPDLWLAYGDRVDVRSGPDSQGNIEVHGISRGTGREFITWMPASWFQIHDPVVRSQPRFDPLGRRSPVPAPTTAGYGGGGCGCSGGGFAG